MNISTLVTIKSNKFNYEKDNIFYSVNLSAENNYIVQFRAIIIGDYRQDYKYSDHDPFLVLRESDEKVIHVKHHMMSDFKLQEGGAGSEVAWTDVTGKPTFSTVATSGSYDDLSDKPTLGTAASQNSSAFATSSQGSLADSAVQPGDLANVATSGSYDDLSNKPVTVTWSNISGKPAVVAEGSSQAAARTAIGAGTSNLTIGTTGSTAKAGNYQPTWEQVTSKPTFGTASASDVEDFATAAQGTLANNAIPSSEKGAQNGVATLDADIKIPKSQLPINFGISTHISSAQASEVMAITGMVDDGMILANVWGLNELARQTPILSIEISGTTVNVTLDTSGTTSGDNLQFGYEVK